MAVEIIRLNLIPDGKARIVHCKQYDEGRIFKVCIYNGNTPYIFTNERVELIVRKGDGNLVTMDLDVVSGDHTLEVVTTEQMCAVSGRNKAEIRVLRDGTNIGSLNFYLQVEAAPDENGITSQSEIKNLNSQITKEVDRILPGKIEAEVPPIVEQIAPPIIEAAVPSAVEEVAEPIVRELVPTVIGNDYYNKTQTDAKFPTKTDFDTALNSKANINTLNDIADNPLLNNWVDGYIRCSGDTIDVTDIRSGEYKCQVVSCSEGDMFTVSGESYGNGARLWAFVSAAGNNLGAEEVNATANKKVIIAPANASKLVVNWSLISYATPDNVVTLYDNKLLVLRVESVEKEYAKTTKDITTLNTFFSSGDNLFNPNADDVEVGRMLNYDGTTSANSSACTSGYIELKAGTYCYLTTTSLYGVNGKYVPKYDSDHNPLGNIEGSVADNVVVFTVSETTFVRLKLDSTTYANVMLVKGSTYPSAFVPYTTFVDDAVKIKSNQIVPFDVNKNVLFGKKIVFDGDSICHGTSVGQESPYYGWGYAGRIGNRNSMDWYNVAQSGATITHGLKFSDQSNRHWVSSNIDTIYANYPDADYIILEGGVNDADLLHNDASKTGTVSQTRFTTFDYDIYAEALDYLFRNAINYFPNAKIGFIVAQKMGVETRYDSNYYRRAFFDMAIDSCKKWSIPYLDLWNESGLHPKVPSQYTVGAQTNLYSDGQHLTDLGYDLITPKIEAWLKTL